MRENVILLKAAGALFAVLVFQACVSERSAGENSAQRETGIASFYDQSFQGKKTANGEIFDNTQFTAAHKTLPFGTKVRVHNLENKKSTTVRINDRGPFIDGRIIDLSQAAAKELDFVEQGTTTVELSTIE